MDVSQSTRPSYTPFQVLDAAKNLYEQFGQYIETKQEFKRVRERPHDGARRVSVGRRGRPLSHHLGRESASNRPGSSSGARRDRKSTRLNSSHANISYAVF